MKKYILVLGLFLLLAPTLLCAAAIERSFASHFRFGLTDPTKCNPGTGDVFTNITPSPPVPKYCCLLNTWCTFGGGAPGGSYTQIQYNNSGVLGGVPGFTWDGSSLILPNFSLKTSTQGALFSTFFGANSDGDNIWIGGGGQSSIGDPGDTYKGAYNTSVGFNALLNDTTGGLNSAFGYDALKLNTTGKDSVAFGVDALSHNTTGGFNAAVGADALYANTTGSNNVAIGLQSLYANITGVYNTGLGNLSLSSNTTGGYNMAVGSNALGHNTTGGHNSAIGYWSLLSNTTGEQNTAIGSDSLENLLTGYNNVGVGMQSLFNDTTGYYNTALGMNALYDLDIVANDGTGSNTAVGYNAGKGIVTGYSNTIIGANVIGLDPALHNNVIIADGDGNQRINVDSTGKTSLHKTTSIQDPSILGAETLTNGALTTPGAEWAVTHDCVLSGTAAVCTYASAGASTLTQPSAYLAIPAKGARYYAFSYSVSSVSGNPTASITTAFASVAVSLKLAGATVFFQAAANPGDFVITTTLTTGQAFTLDNLSLKEIQGGDLFLGGNIYAKNIPAQPYPDSPPTSSSVYDDEFFGSGWDSKWTVSDNVVGGGGSESFNNIWPSAVRIYMVNNATVQLTRTIGGGISGDFSIAAKFYANPMTQYEGFNISVADATGDNQLNLKLAASNSGGTPLLAVSTDTRVATSWTYTINPQAMPNGVWFHHIYLLLLRKSNNWWYYYSMDGYSWTSFGQNVAFANLAGTLSTTIGISMYGGGSGPAANTPYILGVDWFRYNWLLNL